MKYCTPSKGRPRRVGGFLSVFLGYVNTPVMTSSDIICLQEVEQRYRRISFEAGC